MNQRSFLLILNINKIVFFNLDIWEMFVLENSYHLYMTSVDIKLFWELSYALNIEIIDIYIENASYFAISFFLDCFSLNKILSEDLFIPDDRFSKQNFLRMGGCAYYIIVFLFEYDHLQLSLVFELLIFSNSNYSSTACFSFNKKHLNLESNRRWQLMRAVSCSVFNMRSTDD